MRSTRRTSFDVGVIRRDFENIVAREAGRGGQGVQTRDRLADGTASRQVESSSRDTRDGNAIPAAEFCI
ncbi:hypothetical protein [Mycolicibacterium pallens]|uniref:hypothetical protein n=1 Tax=Mycolicibacterium pallens TaxID=370524 RepID=UPI003374D7EA